MKPPPKAKFKPGHEIEGEKLNEKITTLAHAAKPDFQALKEAVTRRNELLDL